MFGWCTQDTAEGGAVGARGVAPGRRPATMSLPPSAKPASGASLAISGDSPPAHTESSEDPFATHLLTKASGTGEVQFWDSRGNAPGGTLSGPPPGLSPAHMPVFSASDPLNRSGAAVSDR